MEKTDKSNAFLTIETFNRMVSNVGLNLRYFISALIVITQLAGSLPYLNCMAGQCASNTQCSSVQCKCCGPNSPRTKSSRESHKHTTGCNQQCPLATTGKTVTITNPQPVASPLFGVSELQPFLTAYAAPFAPSIRESAKSNSPTLLSLSCALTI